MDPIKVMYVFHFNSAFPGGAAQSLLDMIEGLGDRVRPVLVVGKDAVLDRALEGKGIPCYKTDLPDDVAPVGSSDGERSQRDIYLSYEAARKVAAIIQKEGIDLVHINSSIGKVGAIAALMAHVPYVWHIREVMEEHFAKGFLNADLKKALLDRACRRIAISDFVCRIYTEKFHLETERIYNGFDVGRYKNDVARGRRYENVFLEAGSISPGKGQWDAVRAVGSLIGEGYKDLSLIIAGHGETGYIWALKKYVRKKGLDKNIRIIPYQKDLSRLRKEAFYALSCSHDEALGRVTVESMLAGNIVIGARSGATVEIIGNNEERGFLYRVNDVQDLAETMRKAMQLSPSEKDRLAERAQGYAEAVFGLDQCCEKVLDVYERAVGIQDSDQGDALLQQLEKGGGILAQGEEDKKLIDGQRYKRAAMRNDLSLKWIESEQKGFSLESYFRSRRIHRIAIYGMGDLGRRLYDELEDSGIEIAHILDREPGTMASILTFTPVDGEMMDVDAVVVTMLSYEDVARSLYAKGYSRVISLKEILERAEEM